MRKVIIPCKLLFSVNQGTCKMLMTGIDGSFVLVFPFSLGNAGDLFPKAIKKEVISGFLIFLFVCLFQPVDKMILGARALKV